MSYPWDAPRRWLPLAALAAVLPFLGKLPALDEESYLWLGARLDPLRPYDWVRAWPPYDQDGFVYAHPPGWLWWMALWRPFAQWLPLERLLVGAPWVLLLGWAVGRLAERVTRHPSLAGGLWLSSTIVVLGLHDTLMIDLGATALATAALAVEVDAARSGDRRLALLSGVLLGLAAITKYPALAAAAAVGIFQARTGFRSATWLGFLAVFGGVEGAMALAYGRDHLWEVWTRREEIARGPLDERLVGVLARMALLPLPLVLVRAEPAVAAAGALAGLLALVVGRPAGLSGGEVAELAGWVMVGGMGLARLVRGLRPATAKRRRDDAGEAWLLAVFGALWVGGVVGVHNYASARYLLPVAAPVALLVARSAEEVRGGKALVRVSMVLSAALALGVAVADLRFARAGAEVARQAASRGPAGYFAGEWSFRWAMEARGWTRWQPGLELAPGTRVVVVDQASPGVVPHAHWQPVDRVESNDRFPLRVVDLGARVALHAETLGPLPIGFGVGPIEGATIYEVGAAR